MLFLQNIIPLLCLAVCFTCRDLKVSFSRIQHQDVPLEQIVLIMASSDQMTYSPSAIVQF